MRIAILGAGNVGKALARGWRRAGHDVQFGVRDPGKRELREFCQQNGVQAVTLAAAAAPAETVVLAVPWGAVDAVLASCGSLAGKILIDCTNPIAMDDGELALSVGHVTSGGEAIAARHADARVVKTLNQVGAEMMAENETLEARPVMFVAGDDEVARRSVMQLVSELGFEAQDAGGIAAARLLEPFGMLWIRQSIYQGAGRGWAFGMVRHARGR